MVFPIAQDLYFLLDAVRLVHRAGVLSDAEYAAVQSWIKKFLYHVTKVL